MNLEALNYQERFLEAIKNSLNEKYELPLEEIKLLGKTSLYFSEENYSSFKELFFRLFSDDGIILNVSNICQHCVSCHYLMAEEINKFIGVKPILTIGYVNFMGEYFFKFSNIKDCLTSVNALNPKINLHVWLTLPSLEIIDFTFLASTFYKFGDYLVKKQLSETKHFEYYFDFAAELNREKKINYFPKYIGIDTLLKNNLAIKEEIIG